MPDASTIDKLREEVNPVFGTAKSCLQILAVTGDEDSEKLRKQLGFPVFGTDSKQRAPVPEEVRSLFTKVTPVYIALPEVRFFSSNALIEKLGIKQVVDLPCGYTARSAKLSKLGCRYFGLDLPAVISELAPASEKLFGKSKSVSFHEVDATNYSSLRSALKNAQGEIIITTEGMLMYFTQSELETVFANIRNLLLEFGGKWITLDNQLESTQKDLIAAITSDLTGEEASSVGSILASAVSKTTMSNNSFFDSDTEKVKKFVSDMGFNIEVVPMKDYLPATIRAFSRFPTEIQEKARAAFDSANFWVLTAKPGNTQSFICKENNFNASVQLIDGTLRAALTGRLDTITAPSLLELFNEAKAKGEISRIVIDMKGLDYISSAGLRVFLIMKKSLSSGSAVSLENMNETVSKIIESTGFDTIFC